ncbi:hypothetical protein [Jeongeupia sp. USM3]|nr:hypothetical protein [Jeongeupia sp. USM3]
MTMFMKAMVIDLISFKNFGLALVAGQGEEGMASDMHGRQRLA